MDEAAAKSSLKDLLLSDAGHGDLVLPERGQARGFSQSMINPAHPGEILGEDILKELNMSITATAEKLGISRKTLSSIVNGYAPITAETAIKLENVFGKPNAEHWLRMQMTYDLLHARQKLVT